MPVGPGDGLLTPAPPVNTALPDVGEPAKTAVLCNRPTADNANAGGDAGRRRPKASCGDKARGRMGPSPTERTSCRAPIAAGAGTAMTTFGAPDRDDARLRSHCWAHAAGRPSAAIHGLAV